MNDNNSIPIVPSFIHGAERKRLVQLHRLLAFDLAFNRYLAGEATAQEVKERARKMIQAGLPECLK